MNENRFHIIGLNDNTDGNAYLAEHHELIMPKPFTTENLGCFFEQALKMLNTCDHVCIVDDETYSLHDHDLISIAPYAINISKGIYA